MNHDQRGIVLPVLLIVVGLILIGLLATLLIVWKSNEPTATNATTNTNVSVNTNATTPGEAGSGSAGNATTNANQSSNTNTAVSPTNWKTYENPSYGYNLKYPTDWNVEGETYTFPNRVDLPWIDNTDEDKPYAAQGDMSVRFSVHTNVGENFDAWFAANEEYTELDKQETLQNMGGTLTENDLTFSHAKTTSTVNGTPTYLQTVTCKKECAPDGPAFTTKTYYIQDPSNPQRVFAIQAATPTGTKAAALLATFDEMMKTFAIQE